MKFFSSIFHSEPKVTDEEIIAAMEPWTLCCATGTNNGTLGFSYGYDTWLRCAKENFLPQVMSKLPNVRESVILAALTKTVQKLKRIKEEAE